MVKKVKDLKEYIVMNILDLIETVGEEEVKFALSDFSCSRNKEIENFIQNNAIEFAKRKMSITHLILDENGQIMAFFTLTHKASSIGNSLLSKTSQKKLAMHARYDEATDAYSVSAFLIAQFGKNDSYVNELTLSGNQLMDMAISILRYVQRQVGGGIVFLECEDNFKLLAFYQNEHNNYKRYGERFSEKDGVKYIQLLKFF